MYTVSSKSALFSILLLESVILTIAVLLGITKENPSLYFKEGQFVTWLSSIQLLITAIVAWNIFKIRRKQSRVIGWKEPYILWGIIAAGFLYLALDEAVRIHEGLDKLTHLIFNIEETAVSDRLDDVILGAYGLIGIGVLYWYKDEFKKFRAAFPLFVTGFILMFIMVELDIISDRNDIVHIFIKDVALSGTVNSWLGIAEEIVESLSQAFFIVAFYKCLLISRGSGEDRMRKVVRG